MSLYPFRSALAWLKGATTRNWSARMQLVLSLQLSATAMLISGCGPVPIKAEFDSNIVEQKIERSGGVYYDQDLRNLEYIFRQPSGIVWTINLGPGTIALFNSVLQSMFQATSEADSHPVNSTGANNFDGIIVPRIKSFLVRTEKFWLPLGASVGSQTS